MTGKRFKQVVDGVKDTRTGRTLTHPLEFTLKLNEINELYDGVFDRNKELEKENEQLKKENQTFQDQYERKDRQLKRTKKDIEKYTDYFMNELNWDCDRIIKEVFK